jgi:hypothetical protein
MYFFCVLAPRTRATFLLPRPIRGRFWLLNRGTGTIACVLWMGGISLGHRQECLCQSAVSAILAGMEQRFDLVVIPQERDEQV